MNHRLSLVTIASLLLSTASAFAGPVIGPDGRPHETVKIKTKKPPPEVTVSSFSPQTGGIGTAVTITGAGFTPETKLVFGGRSLRVATVAPTQLTFAVPKNFGDGSIVLRHPGIARDIVVGTFAAIADPEIQAFTPPRGPAGARVELRGAGFERGDQVFLGAALISTLAAKVDRFVVTIPPGVASDFFYVQRPGGVRAKSGRSFTVIEPAPTISAITPPGGPAGTRIRITGTNFAAQDLVLYGKKAMQVQSITATTIDALVPADARQDQFILVRGKGGNASSSVKFALELPAVVSRFSPSWGLVGARVEIYGDNFRPGDRVTLNGVDLRIEQLRAEQISVTIPAQARTGVIAVERGGIKTSLAGTFEVLFTPVVAGFSPAGGPVNTKVTISGHNFSSDAEVFWGVQKLKVVERLGDVGLTFLVPRASADQKITVRTRAGAAESATAFQVHIYGEISGLEPRSGYVGTRVTLSGRELGRIDSVYLGNVMLPIIEKAPRRLVVEIPAGATDGTIAVESFRTRRQTELTFSVLRAPVITSLSPLSGPPGTQVTITGQSFSQRTQVQLGGKNLRVLSRAVPTQLVVLIPREARGSSPLVVIENDRQITSAQSFTVVVPPTFVSFAPRAGKIGSQVTITGEDLSATTEVWLGKQQAPIVSRSGNTIVVKVPAVRNDEPMFRVRDANGETIAKKRFTILPSASITAIKPAQAQVGAEITVTGVGFEPGVRFWLRGVEMQAKKISGNGTRATLLVPNVAVGTDFIDVEDIGEHTRSTLPLEVIAPPPPPPANTGGSIDVRDHRRGGKNKTP